MAERSELDRLQSDLRDSQAAAEGYKSHIAELETRRDSLLVEIDGLEGVVARLEAEGLKPLVDRLRVQIISIRKLVVAMAIAIDELTEQPPSAK